MDALTVSNLALLASLTIKNSQIGQQILKRIAGSPNISKVSFEPCELEENAFSGSSRDVMARSICSIRKLSINILADKETNKHVEVLEELPVLR